MADGTLDVQGPAKLPGNSDGIDLDAIKALMVRDAYVEDWPQDERELHHRPGWLSFRERTEAVQQLRAEKIVALILTEHSAEVERLRAENEHVTAQRNDIRRLIGAAAEAQHEAEAERDAALARIRAVEALCDEVEARYCGFWDRQFAYATEIRAALAVQPEDGGE